MRSLRQRHAARVFFQYILSRGVVFDGCEIMERGSVFMPTKTHAGYLPKFVHLTGGVTTCLIGRSARGGYRWFAEVGAQVTDMYCIF